MTADKVYKTEKQENTMNVRKVVGFAILAGVIVYIFKDEIKAKCKVPQEYMDSVNKDGNVFGVIHAPKETEKEEA